MPFYGYKFHRTEACGQIDANVQALLRRKMVSFAKQRIKRTKWAHVFLENDHRPKT